MPDTLPTTFFAPWELVISATHPDTGRDLKTSAVWNNTFRTISELLDLATNERRLVWRGVTNSAHSLHSSLYRTLNTGSGTPPDEAALLAVEREQLDRARSQWRFDNLDALELLAHLQHYGAPTRLL